MSLVAFEPRLTLPIGPVTYTVGLCNMDQFPPTCTPEGNHIEGLCDPYQQVILVSAALTEPRRMLVLGHEIVHAWFSETDESFYARLVGCKTRYAEKSEERLCQWVGPIVAQTFIVGNRKFATAMRGQMRRATHMTARPVQPSRCR